MSSRKLIYFLVVAAGLACVLPGGIASPTPPQPTPAPSPSSPPSATDPAGPPTPPPPSPTSLHADWPVYTDTDFDFEFRYPPGSTVDGPSSGRGRIDLPFAQGTNLTEKYEQVDARADSACETPLVAGYEPGAIPIQLREISGKEFAMQSGAEGAAGSTYEWVAYSTFREPTCVSLSFVLRSSNPGLYDNPLPEFDRSVEIPVFGEIVATFAWLSP